MPKATKEWEMVCNLNQIKTQITNRNQRQFVESLYELLDEFSPISEQQSADQIEYLYSIYRNYIGELKSEIHPR